MDATDVYEYLDHGECRKDWYSAKKVDNPRFSQRSFVRKTGQESSILLAGVKEALPAGVRGCHSLGQRASELW